MSEQISTIAYEIAIARFERVIKRLWILCIILLGILLATNAGWLYYESQFVSNETSVEQEIDTGDGDTMVIGVGDYHGTSTSDGNNTDENKTNP